MIPSACFNVEDSSRRPFNLLHYTAATALHMCNFYKVFAWYAYDHVDDDDKYEMVWNGPDEDGSPACLVTVSFGSETLLK